MVVVFADIHGSMRDVQKVIKEADLRECTIVQVGDFGYSFSDSLQTRDEFMKSLRFFNKQFKARNIQFLACRGNHDNPEYFDGSVALSHLKLLPDYTAVELYGERWLFVGGATSIDRTDRREGKTWWPDEVFVYDKEKLASVIGDGFDVVVTHTAPSDVANYGLFGRSEVFADFCKKDKTLATDVHVEANKVQNLAMDILEARRPKVWYFGHYHTTRTIEQFGVKFVCLGLTRDYPNKSECIMHK